LFLSANDEPSWITMSWNRETAAFPSGASRQRLNAQALEESAKHLVHELRKAGVREPVVERLVGNRDVVLVIEFAQQVSDRLDLSTSETGDRREEQAVQRDGAEPFTLPRLEAELVDVIGG
jgi:hypothetical protein